ncbi:DUF938 domain-containing protein [Alteromonas sp. C1M14]|uniref:DUF938 domain-containing protein n=1 Tax=Alteromonas sp. C1M14 TaxID=2841567 RepID=UPI001C083364|nr:DUF938 domain-containing protein [Alteromonas sp. C1M14]MBU2977992.1 DUF938 domain-containing protein [Alteromonas sp. C1M14]
MTNELPYSQSCENNKDPILAILKQTFAASNNVLEVGSGTGQHAVHFASNLPHLVWQTSDQLDYHDGLRQRLAAFPTDNVLPPIALKVGESSLPFARFDSVFSANTAHIMQQAEIAQMMKALSDDLPADGCFCQYGPFIENGEFNSQGNADFHEYLVTNGYGGYRDIDELKSWAPNLSLIEIHRMPANNLLLEWRKK